MAKEIPVYLFVGFLESGKTKFIQETFEDPNYDSGDKTLLLICEEGEEEYNEKKFAFPGDLVQHQAAHGVVAGVGQGSGAVGGGDALVHQPVFGQGIR